MDLLRRQQCVHRSRPESFEIEGYELESETFEDGGEFGRHGRTQGSIHFFTSDLDADDFAVMPDAKLPESEDAKGIFATLDHVERLARDGSAVFDPRREASRCRFVPDPKASTLRQIANVLLGQSSFQKRCRNMMESGRLLPWPEIALIVHVYTVRDRVEATGRAKVFHDSEKFVLAVEASLPVVADILSPLEFERRDYFHRNALFIRESQRIGKMGAGEAGGIRDHGQRSVSQNPMSDPRKIRGIDSARVGDQQPA